MAGKTISAYTDEETARLVGQLAKVEHRTPSQIAAAALGFYVRLPPQAHAALRELVAMGSPEDMNLMLREVTRAINRSAYDAAVRTAAPQVREKYGDTLRTEEDIEAEAVRLTARRPPEVRRRAVQPSTRVADSEARPRSRRRR